MELVLIGPVYPYKGGISHYTGLMYRALSKKHEVHMISYKMQYPKILFKKEQRDYSNDSFKIEDTEFLINTANPFNWFSVAGKINKINPDAVIIQWWHPYFAPCYKALCMGIKKSIRKIFVCHNVFPHERFPMDRTLAKLVLKEGNGFIVQSSMDMADLQSIKSDAKIELAVHPTYNAFKLEGMSKETARERINVSEDTKILLFFGFVREYKGLKHLIKAMPKIKSEEKDLRLFIVGDFGEDKQDYIDLINENCKDSVTVVDGYIPDKEVEKYFAASDLVVLPYESATQSGIVQIAYGFGKPVVATNVGGLPEVVTDGKTGYIAKPQDPEDLSDKIIRFFKENKAEEFEKEIEHEAYRFSWDRMTEHVESLLEENT